MLEFHDAFTMGKWIVESYRLDNMLQDAKNVVISPNNIKFFLDFKFVRQIQVIFDGQTFKST
mgnify:FL=1